MAQLVSIKDLLVSYDPTSPTDEKGAKYRGTSHEFQDYAYRLASDLRDLDHLHIYMRFAKQYPRYILDSVYQYIADIDESNKGKLFMWRFKVVREELKIKKLNLDFSWDNIYSRMSKFHDEFNKAYIKKDTGDTMSNLEKIIDFSDFTTNNNISRLLVLDTFRSSTISKLAFPGYRIFSLTMSKEVSKYLKKKFEGINNIKIIAKDFFSNSYKDFFYDCIIIDNTWTMVPLNEEVIFLKELRRMLSTSGKIIFKYKSTEQESNEGWKSIDIESNNRYYFQKINNVDSIKQTIAAAGFRIINEFELGGENFMMVSNL